MVKMLLLLLSMTDLQFHFIMMVRSTVDLYKVVDNMNPMTIYIVGGLINYIQITM